MIIDIHEMVRRIKDLNTGFILKMINISLDEKVK